VYQAANAWCENGMLIVEARRERRANPDYEAGSPNWKRARELPNIPPQPHHQGRRELALGRSRCAPASTLAPACGRFWTLAWIAPGPPIGEIDIMEYYRGTLLANLIWAGPERTASFTAAQADCVLR